MMVYLRLLLNSTVIRYQGFTSDRVSITVQSGPQPFKRSKSYGQIFEALWKIDVVLTGNCFDHLLNLRKFRS